MQRDTQSFRAQSVKPFNLQTKDRKEFSLQRYKTKKSRKSSHLRFWRQKMFFPFYFFKHPKILNFIIYYICLYVSVYMCLLTSFCFWRQSFWWISLLVGVYLTFIPSSYIRKCQIIYAWKRKPNGGCVPLYLEVGVDLHEEPPCNSDIVGGHHLPLEDGQRNIRARRQVWIGNWLQAHWRSRLAACHGVTLESYHLHVGQSLHGK